MKNRDYLLLFLLLLLSGPAAAAERGVVLVPDAEHDEVTLYRGSHALLIGVSDYTNGWPDLESVPGELKQVERVLKAQGFEVEKSLNPDAQKLKWAFEDFIGQHGYKTDNRLLFYFAGHGHTRKGTKGYLVPADAPLPVSDEIGFLRKALDMNQVIAWTRRIEAKHALFLFDSCFSGIVFKARNRPEPPRHITNLTREPVRQFITAGSAGETVPARSTFAQVFVDAFEHRLADLDKDGFVTGTELGYHIQSTVPKFVSQTPQFGKHPDYELARGDFVFVLPEQESITTERKQNLEPEMVSIRGGCFQMGSPTGEEGRQEDERQHRVCVNDFKLSQYEVTVASFRQFVDATSYRTDAERGDGCAGWTGTTYEKQPEFSWKHLGFRQGEAQPVACVSWNDALAYTEWFSREAGKPYRLPTEAEWEYTCRGGQSGERYCGGNDIDALAWYSDNSGDKTYPVGVKQANAFGLYDMSGNVWEWTCSK